jgi:hypothetical protein
MVANELIPSMRLRVVGLTAVTGRSSVLTWISLRRWREGHERKEKNRNE